MQLTRVSGMAATCSRWKGEESGGDDESELDKSCTAGGRQVKVKTLCSRGSGKGHSARR